MSNDDEFEYPDHERRSHERRQHGVIYVGSNHSHLIPWLLGIAATLVTGSIMTCAALLWNMNATMNEKFPLILYRLDQVERSVKNQ